MKIQILATAIGNKKYRWHRNINFTIQARLVNNQVRYYEITDNYESCLSEQLVKSLFPNGMIKDRPFLVKENQDFYAVLNRHKNHYKAIYEELKKDNSEIKRTKHSFIRTKFKKQKS